MSALRGQQVLLLKTKSHPTDPYDIFFRSNEADPVFVPVLEHRQVNLDVIKRKILEGSIEGFGTTVSQSQAEYGGVIITSQRAVEALGTVLDSVKDTIQPGATTHPIYVVGPATEKSVIDLGFPASNVYGAHCGNGQALAEYILDHYKSNKRLLFLVGEIRRDVIPKTLTAGGIGVKEVVIYETQVVSNFGENLTRVLELGDQEDEWDNKKPSRWIVIFSPSGSDAAMEILGRKPQSIIPTIPCVKRNTYVATIGPTTASYLRDVLNVQPDVVASTPTPQGLLFGIEQFLSNLGDC